MEIQAIKAHLKSVGMTYEDLSARSGIPVNTLKNIFRGKTRNPRIDTMQAIEAALELNKSPLQWTDEEKAAGVGAHGTNLSNDEWEWLELRTDILEAKGEAGLHAMQTIIKTYTEKNK